MAPEQLHKRNVDGRADLFALGAMMFEMLTGRRAFEGEDDASMISAVLKGDPPPVCGAVRPDAPAAVDRLVAACLAKEPDTRWHCASDLVRALDCLHDARRPGRVGVAHQLTENASRRGLVSGFATSG
jgi:eukaryotic-like serine/threonine-protein kinase